MGSQVLRTTPRPVHHTSHVGFILCSRRSKKNHLVGAYLYITRNGFSGAPDNAHACSPYLPFWVHFVFSEVKKNHMVGAYLSIYI